MAAPSEMPAGGDRSGLNREGENYDEELDFFSAKFNPERALLSPNVSVPYPDVKSFDDVRSYEDAVKRRQQERLNTMMNKQESSGIESQSSKQSSTRTKSAERHRSQKRHNDSSWKSKSFRSFSATGSCKSDKRQLDSKTVPEPKLSHTDNKAKSDGKASVQSTCELTKTGPSKVHPQQSVTEVHIQPVKPSDEGEGSSIAMTKKGQDVKTKRNVFTRMEAMVGPLRLLTRCVEERLQVRVMTRGAVLVKSICRGYIVAFDKYYNMAMIDVDEIYRRPAVQGKVRSRISHKLLAAQRTLKQEREECQTKWKTKQEAKNREVAAASSNLQGLSILPDVNIHELKNILSSVSQKQDSDTSSASKETRIDPSVGSSASKDQSLSLTKSCSSQKAVFLKSSNEVLKDEQSTSHQKHLKSSQVRLKSMQSVYEDLKAPLSAFEREALMLGIPDENIEHRHISQLFIRGENVVLVNIIDDF